MSQEREIERARHWIEGERSTEYRKILLNRCKDDILFWVETFCHTYDPRVEPAKIPFILYPFQRWALKEWERHIREQKYFLVEKTRDMGVTWLVLLLFQHGWLFHGFDFLIGSRKEDYVDTLGDMSTHFPKLRFNLYNMPAWMRPVGFNPKKHDTFMKMVHPVTNNTITGESSNPNFARGGRYRAVLFDEFAFWPYADPAWASASHSTKCRIGVSTPYGKANKFARLALAADNDRVEPPSEGL